LKEKKGFYLVESTFWKENKGYAMQKVYLFDHCHMENENNPDENWENAMKSDVSPFVQIIIKIFSRITLTAK
jgi:hypothetical protein